MRAVRIHSFGGPEVVSIDEVPKPVPGMGEVLIDVAAAGINPVDWKIREGYLKDVMPFPLPLTLGNEVAGWVAAVGPDVTSFKVGDRVHGSVGMTGGLADYAVASASNLAVLPETIDTIDGSVLPVAACTAMAALEAGEVTSGSRVLVHAAAGGVGSMFIQLAKLRSATIIAVTAADNVDYIRSLGADQVLIRGEPWDNHVEPVDVVLDGFGPSAQDASWHHIKPGGILLSLVHPPSQSDASSRGVRATMIFGQPDGAKLAETDILVSAGAVKVRIASVHPIEHVAKALAASQSGPTVGKVAVTFPRKIDRRD